MVFFSKKIGESGPVNRYGKIIKIDRREMDGL